MARKSKALEAQEGDGAGQAKCDVCGAGGRPLRLVEGKLLCFDGCPTPPATGGVLEPRPPVLVGEVVYDESGGPLAEMRVVSEPTSPPSADGPVESIQVAEIAESKTNPRTAFDETAMKELEDSVRKHGVLQPVLVRCAPPGITNGWRYELVCGARRLRAAKAAGLTRIPALVRALEDKECLEIQMIENLQREDLGPMDEAAGYQALTTQHGYSVEELAVKVGRSQSYVRGRLHLTNLVPEVAAMCREGKLDASRALLIARIPVPKLQAEAAKAITTSRWDGVMSFRAASDYIQRTYMLALKGAPFRTGQAVAGVGPCRECPKRTGAQRELFGDVESADVCTDPVCYARKADAHWEEVREAALKAGKKVVEDEKEADRICNYSRHQDLSHKCFEDPKQRTYAQLLKGTDVEVLVVRDPHGKPAEYATYGDVQKALRAAGHDFADDGGLRHRGASAESNAEAAHKRRKAAIAAALPDLVKLAEASEDLTGLFRLVVGDLLSGHAEPVRLVQKRRGCELSRKGLEKMAIGELQGLAVELIAVDGATYTFGSGYGDGWTSACKLLGLEMKAYEKAKAKGKKKAKPA